MIITKTVQLQWTIANKKYYTQKGYIFTNLFDYFTVKVEDLPPESRMDVQYRCEMCGEIKTTRYGRFLKNTKCICKSCNMKLVASNREYIKKRSGKQSGKYNPNLTDEEREKGRHYPEYPIWRNEVYKINKYTCMNCGDDTGGNLVAHHINSWNFDKNNRFFVYNGITLCNKCHTAFHDKYGYGNNNLSQLAEFLLSDIEYDKLSDVGKVFFDPPVA